MDFRCVKINMPKKDKLDFFKDFADMCSFYLFNKIMIEVGKEDLLRTADITEMCDYCDELGIEVIPYCEHGISEQVSDLFLCANMAVKGFGEFNSEELKKKLSELKKVNSEILLTASEIMSITSKTGEECGNTLNTYTVVPKGYKILNDLYDIKEESEEILINSGLEPVMYNFNPTGIYNFYKRVGKGVCGICLVNNAEFNEEIMQRNGIFLYMAYSHLMFTDVSFNEDKFQENFLKAADSVCRYKNRLLITSPHIEITHTTHVFMEHDSFENGYIPDYENEYIGKYILTYEDGSKEVVPVYYGLNIGNSKADFYRELDFEKEMMNICEQLAEVTYSCVPSREGATMYYTFIYPLKDNIKNIELNSEEIILKSVYEVK